MKKSLVLTIIVVLLVGTGAFFAGMKYQQNKRGSQFRQFSGNGIQQGQRAGGNRIGLQPVNGEILSADNKSITVKLQDGSSKIVIYSDSTKVNKNSEGSKEDLKVGEQVMVISSQGTDGTVTAQSISVGGNVLRGMPSGQPSQ